MREIIYNSDELKPYPLSRKDYGHHPFCLDAEKSIARYLFACEAGICTPCFAVLTLLNIDKTVIHTGPALLIENFEMELGNKVIKVNSEAPYQLVFGPFLGHQHDIFIGQSQGYPPQYVSLDTTFSRLEKDMADTIAPPSEALKALVELSMERNQTYSFTELYTLIRNKLLRQIN